MNPPYTRDSLRHRQFSNDDKKRMKTREKTLTKGRAGHGSSAGTTFIDLGEHLTRFDNGSTLAFVYPLAGSAAPSAHEVRKLLADWFHIEWVIYSHDPKRYCFSENTTISEMLVVARRDDAEPKDRPPTKFVCLRRNTTNPARAAVLAEQLRAGNPDEEIAYIVEHSSAEIADGRWRPLAIQSQYLVQWARRLVTDARLVPLQSISEVGPDGRSIRKNFVKKPHSDQSGRRSLWHNDTDAVSSLTTEPDVYIHPKGGRQRQCDTSWARRTHLLYCDKARLNTVRLFAAFCEERTVSNHWVPISPDQDELDVSKALAVWLNSTLGVIGGLSVSSPNVLDRVNFSIKAIESIPAPAFAGPQLFDAKKVATSQEHLRSARPYACHG